VGIVEGGSITAPVQTAISFSDGLSVAEWEAPVGGSFATAATVEYQRGPDMGGGIGGLLYSSRSDGILPSPTIKHNLFNVQLPEQSILQEDLFAAKTWQFLGLRDEDLIWAAAMSGAAAGVGIDVLTAGVSFGVFAAMPAVQPLTTSTSSTPLLFTSAVSQAL
jgi:hypothetical protein